jgi:16S rRNA (cytosine967-C5)-methyltransferase
MRRIASARDIALDALDRVRAGRFAEHALSERLEREQLSREDRALATELVYGVLRWRYRLDALIDRGAAASGKRIKPAIREILRIALYQLVLLERIPPHAAVNEAVAQARRRFGTGPAGFVNAVLRNALRQPSLIDPTPTDDPVALATFFSHPEWLVRRWLVEWGPETTRRILVHNNSRANVDLRVNGLKSTVEEVMQSLKRAGVSPGLIATVPGAIRVSALGGPIHSLPGYDEGLFAVQDVASQLVAPLLPVRQGESVLDACAAPGGKSAHLASLAQNQIRLVVMDADPVRLEETRNNLRRLGVVVERFVQGDAEDAECVRDLGEFDRILLDAPCTGMGVLRHNPEAKYRLTADDPSRLASRQLRMMSASAHALKPGGMLVYSVCTVSREETWAVMDSFLTEHIGFTTVPVEEAEVCLPGLIDAHRCFNTFPPPSHEQMDGFFAARILRLC